MTVVSFAHRRPAADIDFGLSGSDVDFTAVTRPLFGIGIGKDGSEVRLPVPDHVGVYRANPVTREPMPLGVVGSDYKLIQHRDVFEPLEDTLRTEVRPDLLEGAKATSKIAFSGAWAKREYILPAFGGKVVTDTGWASEVGFRVIAWNSLDGSSSAGVMTGLIDFHCANGLILGKMIERKFLRHTKNADPERFAVMLRSSLQDVQAEVRRYEIAANTPLDLAKAEKLLRAEFSERLANRLMERVEVEARVRGRNVFALQSALTYYSSHDSEAFPTRNTANDHAAKTLHEREIDVARIVNGRGFAELLAA